MSEDESNSLSDSAGSEIARLGASGRDFSGELVVAVTAEGMLVDGDPKVVRGYLDKIKAAAGQAVDIVGITKGAVGSTAGLAVGAASVFAQSGQFVQLSARSMEAIRIPVRVSSDETFDVGEDSGTPVNRDYDVPFRFTAELHKVVVELKPAKP
jgi:hypothetical protein